MAKGINIDEKILNAIQALYTDIYKTADRQLVIEQELHEIKLCFIALLKRFQSIDEMEKRIFGDNLKKD